MTSIKWKIYLFVFLAAIFPDAILAKENNQYRKEVTQKFDSEDETVPNDKCETEKPRCMETGGSCFLDSENILQCLCPGSFTYTTDAGCMNTQRDFCKDVCGENPAVICEGDKTKKETVACACEKEDMVFDKITKECKVDYCLVKCGKVKCIGNKFSEEEIECVCPTDSDFDEVRKLCKVNYCKRVCGHDLYVTCTGNEYEPKTATKDCGCEDEDYAFINKKCQKKCNQDEDCMNEGKCESEGEKKLCKCKPGTYGDMCEDIIDCLKGRYKDCKGDRGDCVFERGRAKCICPNEKFFYARLGYCEVPCTKDNPCIGSNKQCNSDGFCVCQEGYEGKDCNEVTGCKDLAEKCEVIGTECVLDKNAPNNVTCKCNDGYSYDRKHNLCKHSYCHPTNPCKGVAMCEESNGIGYCKCPDNKYYNYKAQQCAEIVADKCFLKKTKCGQYEECNKGECICKYPKENREDCKPKLCRPNPCFPNANCSINDGSCFCTPGKYFLNKRCEDLKCRFDEYEKKCDCPRGMKREKYGEKCKPSSGEECSKDCGYGICVEKDKKEGCKCFDEIAVLTHGKCILNKRFCASRQLQENLMKCNCVGQYTQADDGVTCRLKTCADSGVKEECASKGGKCEMDWKGNGYYCKCPEGYIEDKNGKCTDPCSIERNIMMCAQNDQFCYNSRSFINKLTATCQCPPTTTKGYNGKCSQKAENVYMIKNIFVLKKRYEVDSVINKVLLNSDLMQSLEQTFSDSLFDYGYLYDYRISGDIVICSAWINFKRDPKKTELDKVKFSSMKLTNVCDDCIENVMFWPPNMFLNEKGLNEVIISKLEFCSNEVKDVLCGKAAICINNKCLCMEGFKTVEYSIKNVSGNIIQRCEDIDECAKDSQICGKNTTCVNIYGSYKCVCKEGYKKETTSYDPETDKSDCYDMCTPSPCKKGKCSLEGKSFNCECEPGFGGSFCDRKDENQEKAKKHTVIVGAVLGFLLTFAALAILFYVIKIRKYSGSKKLKPGSRTDCTEMAEREHVRGAVNKSFE